LEFTFTRYVFTLNMISIDSLTPKPRQRLWIWFQSIPWPQNLGKDTKFITPRQMQMELYWV